MNTANLELEPLARTNEVAHEVVDAAPTAQAPRANREIALATLQKNALADLSVVDRGIAQLVEEHGATDYDVTTPKGMKLAIARRAAFRDVRYKVPHIVKDRKAELKAITGLLDTEGERIAAALKVHEDKHDAVIKAEEARKAEEAAKAKVRTDAFEANLARITGLPEMAKGKTSVEIQAGIEWLNKKVIDPLEWEEFSTKAATAKQETLTALIAMRDAAKAAEDKAADDERVRAENEARALAMTQMQEVQGIVMQAMGQPSDMVKQAIDALAGHASSTSTDPAVQQARAMVDAQLRQILTMAQNNEAMAAQLAASQAAAAPPPAPEPAPAPAAPEVVVTTLPHTGAVPEATELGTHKGPAPQPVSLVAQNKADREEVNALASATEEPADTQVASTGAVLSTGAVCEQYGFTMTTDFIRSLGLRPQPNPAAKSGTYWAESDLPRLDLALIEHIECINTQRLADKAQQ